MSQTKLSPGMQQYVDMKKDSPDAFLFFRMGDFYELFYEDATRAAQILEISITSRNKNAADPIPMAGVPYHSAQQYIDTLIEQGYKVAIAEQMEDPKQAKGVVKREVVQVVTPGTSLDGPSRDGQNNFLVALYSKGQGFGLAHLDLATGEFGVTQLDRWDLVLSEIRNLQAKEVVLAGQISEEQEALLSQQLQLLVSWVDKSLDASPLLPSTLSELAFLAAASLLAYIYQTQMRDLDHLKPVEVYQIADSLRMDFATKQSLDLTEHARTGKKQGSLLGVLDQTRTAMGLRLLRRWIQQPLLDKDKIEQRQEQVTILLEAFFERQDLVESLKGVYDIERLVSRVSFGKTLPKDLLQLSATLGQVPQIRQLLLSLEQAALEPLVQGLDPLEELYALIDAAIDPEAPNQLMDGGLIKTGFDPVLDQYRKALREGTSWLADLESRERQATGINNLKIDYNRKDGYYFHVTQSQLSHVPDHFYRKATLKNSERFGSQELAQIEGQLLEARDQSSQLEYDLFMRIREEVAKYMPRLQSLAGALASVDVLQSLAFVAESQLWVKPTFNQTGQIHVLEGRHPVVEAVLGRQSYVPNSLIMAPEDRIQLITGPNMSGKSTYMRQIAIMVILAQLGSYVPAKEADLPIFDAIFTRIGAADDLVSGQSTFMVEMMEANQAVQHASPQSLILFDELGRGTATYDGMALAQALIEYIHDKVGAKTFFATHYHELTDLENHLSGLANVHVATLEEGGTVTFLHKIETGPADQSYGIHVAKIAGLPRELLTRAQVILDGLESQDVRPQTGQLDLFQVPEAPPVQPHPLLEQLKTVNLSQMTPLEALLFLDQAQKELQAE